MIGDTQAKLIAREMKGRPDVIDEVRSAQRRKFEWWMESDGASAQTNGSLDKRKASKQGSSNALSFTCPLLSLYPAMQHVARVAI